MTILEPNAPKIKHNLCKIAPNEGANNFERLDILNVYVAIFCKNNEFRAD